MNKFRLLAHQLSPRSHQDSPRKEVSVDALGGFGAGSLSPVWLKQRLEREWMRAEMAEEELQVLTAHREAADKEIEKLKATVNRFGAMLVEADQELCRLSAHVGAKEGELSASQQQLQMAQDWLQQGAQQLEAGRAVTAALQMQHQDLQHKHSSLAREVDAMIGNAAKSLEVLHTAIPDSLQQGHLSAKCISGLYAAVDVLKMLTDLQPKVTLGPSWALTAARGRTKAPPAPAPGVSAAVGADAMAAEEAAADYEAALPVRISRSTSPSSCYSASPSPKSGSLARDVLGNIALRSSSSPRSSLGGSRSSQWASVSDKVAAIERGASTTANTSTEGGAMQPELDLSRSSSSMQHAVNSPRRPIDLPSLATRIPAAPSSSSAAEPGANSPRVLTEHGMPASLTCRIPSAPGAQHVSSSPCASSGSLRPKLVHVPSLQLSAVRAQLPAEAQPAEPGSPQVPAGGEGAVAPGVPGSTSSSTSSRPAESTSIERRVHKAARTCSHMSSSLQQQLGRMLQGLATPTSRKPARVAAAVLFALLVVVAAVVVCAARWANIRQAYAVMTGGNALAQCAFDQPSLRAATQSHGARL